MSSTLYGYVRVSSRTQKEDRQMVAMQQFGVDQNHIVVEKMSGKDFDRPLYQKLVQTLQPGDTLVVKSIDRLGRNYTEILEQWTLLTKEREVAIVVLDMPLLDTRTRKDLAGTLVSDIVLQLLSYVAQTERDFLHQRQREGIAVAKANGVHFGRERADFDHDLFEELALDWWNGRISAVKASERMGISRFTFARRVREWCEHEGLKCPR